MIYGLLAYIALIALILFINKKYWDWFYKNYPQEKEKRDQEQTDYLRKRKG